MRCDASGLAAPKSRRIRYAYNSGVEPLRTSFTIPQAANGKQNGYVLDLFSDFVVQPRRGAAKAQRSIVFTRLLLDIGWTSGSTSLAWFCLHRSSTAYCVRPGRSLADLSTRRGFTTLVDGDRRSWPSFRLPIGS
jgi:hypothetical protein